MSKVYCSVITCILLTFSAVGLARTYTTAREASPQTVAETASNNVDLLIDSRSLFDGRICFYEEKRYSLGSFLSVDGILLECVVENTVESNGRLRWERVSQTEH